MEGTGKRKRLELLIGEKVLIAEYMISLSFLVLLLLTPADFLIQMVTFVKKKLKKFVN